MPLEIEPRTTSSAVRAAGGGPAGAPIVIALVNNMPDAALHSTESQFSGLLHEASADRAIQLRLTSLPELPRSAEALEYIHGAYWPLDEALARPLDALIVTGTEPRAPLLTEEPYWRRFVELLSFARGHTLGSVWSCLAAHAAVLSLDGIERQRLAAKRCGVYEHHILSEHPLLAGVEAPMPMPHSRWNELSPQSLRAAGYTLLSWSQETGADAFAREEQSLLLFFQGHPEYEATTLLREYRRDVGRYLSGQQSHYPTLPHGYLPPAAAVLLSEFRERALAGRDVALLENFPFAAVAQLLHNRWRGAAVALYRNWLDSVLEARAPRRVPETVSLTRP
ncbi:MAG: homoserine O-succinyltransferase [Sinobacteraceae bacterium]|nr:homoserine O-succinyltransferase [Nevskiaceae bacterium]MBV9316016.1 homoserine O-succinyltransferase [Gammaproteobacteria bacterium]